MNTFNEKTVTAQSIATMAMTHVKDQARIDYAFTLSFAGKSLVAHPDSILHGAAVILAKKADEFRKAKKDGKIDKDERFQAVNMLATMINRSIKKTARFDGKRVSIRTSAKQGVSVALVEGKNNNHKAKPSKGKGAKDTGIKGVKDLASLLQYAVDNYGLESVVAEVEKMATDPKQVAKLLKS